MKDGSFLRESLGHTNIERKRGNHFKKWLSHVCHRRALHALQVIFKHTEQTPAQPGHTLFSHELQSTKVDSSPDLYHILTSLNIFLAALFSSGRVTTSLSVCSALS